jgi:hypothetical protein
MWQRFSRPKDLLTLAILAFVAWLIPLVTLLILESFHLGATLFSSGVATYTYIVVHGLLTLGAIALSVLTLIRGPRRSRLIVIVPLVILIIYAGMLIGGPG